MWRNLHWLFTMFLMLKNNSGISTMDLWKVENICNEKKIVYGLMCLAI